MTWMNTWIFQWVSLAIICITGLSCGQIDDVGPDISPSHLQVDAVAGASQIAPLRVTNSGDKIHKFRFGSSSERIEIKPDKITLEIGENHVLQAHIHCPRETGTYRDTIVIIDDERILQDSISATVNCHPSPDIGSGSLSVDISGLPDGERARVEIYGPKQIEYVLTMSHEAPIVPPGHYLIIAHRVDILGHEFEVSQERFEFTIFKGEHHDIHVEYALPADAEKASMSVQATGLPEGQPASFFLDGPGLAGRFIFPASFAELEPGPYSLQIPEISSDDAEEEPPTWIADNEKKEFFLFPGEYLEETISFREIQGN